jgi:hypothetical protein
MWVELAAVRLCPANPGRVRDTPAANRLGQAGARLDTGPLAVTCAAEPYRCRLLAAPRCRSPGSAPSAPTLRSSGSACCTPWQSCRWSGSWSTGCGLPSTPCAATSPRRSRQGRSSVTDGAVGDIGYRAALPRPHEDPWWRASPPGARTARDRRYAGHASHCLCAPKSARAGPRDRVSRVRLQLYWSVADEVRDPTQTQPDPSSTWPRVR